MLNDPQVRRCADRYQLGLPNLPTAGRSGELLGRGTGSSLEFQEYRQYMPGDDIRHLDWGAFARSDQLMVRLYREEISPRTQIFVDVSRSMQAGDQAKPLVTRQLASLLGLLCAQLGNQAQIVPLSEDRPLPILQLAGLDSYLRRDFTSQVTLPELLEQHRVPFKPQSLRIVISDFLFPHDPQTLIRQLAAGASVLWVIQLLQAWEADPRPVGGRRLIDMETTAELDLQIDARAIENYQRRLNALQTDLQRQCRRAHAVFVTLIADRGLETLCRDNLTAAGLLRAS